MTENERELDFQLGDAQRRIRELEAEIAQLRARIERYERVATPDLRIGLANGPFCTAYHFEDESTGEAD